ncbi:MAG: hypothetical protein AAF726_12685 [Planctomycetota bacterium]
MLHWIRKHPALAGVLCYALLVACVSGKTLEQHRWWSGNGPVLPHDTFPADCTLCHEGSDWNDLVDDFNFDHEAETGVPLVGSHSQARCLRCHNDRGPIDVFNKRGCGGCHEDVHVGQLGQDCLKCHTQVNWRPFGQLELHQRTRFPLLGVHAAISCRRCHPGAEIGRFIPTPIECINCHYPDLQQANNPNHANLGWTFDCHRCHQPTLWNNASLDPNFPF